MSSISFNKTRKNPSSSLLQSSPRETQEKKLRAQIVQTNKEIGFTKRELGKDGLATTKRSSLKKQLKKLKQKFGECKAKFKKHCGGPFYLDFSKNKNVSNVSKGKRNWWHKLGYKLFSRKELLYKTETEQIKLAEENSRKSQELWAREEEDLQAALALSIQSQQEEAQRKLTQEKVLKPVEFLEQENVSQESNISAPELSNNLEKNQTPPKIEDLLRLNEYVYPVSTVDFYKLIDDLIKVMSQKNLKEVLIDDIAYDKETLSEIKKGGEALKKIFKEDILKLVDKVFKNPGMRSLFAYVNQNKSSNTNSCRPTTILSILSEEDPFGKGF